MHVLHVTDFENRKNLLEITDEWRKQAERPAPVFMSESTIATFVPGAKALWL
jgi:hypothetical protein